LVRGNGTFSFGLEKGRSAEIGEIGINQYIAIKLSGAAIGDHPGDRRRRVNDYGRLDGVAICRFRDHWGWSQQDLAELLGVSRPVISHWECGRQRPTGTAAIVLGAMIDATGHADDPSEANRELITRGYRLHQVMHSVIGRIELVGWLNWRLCWTVPLGVQDLVGLDGLSADAIIVDCIRDGVRREGGLSVDATECVDVADLAAKLLPVGHYLLMIVPRARSGRVTDVVGKRLAHVDTADGHLDGEVRARILLFRHEVPHRRVQSPTDGPPIDLDTTAGFDEVIEWVSDPHHTVLCVGTDPAFVHTAIMLQRRVLLAHRDPIELAKQQEEIDDMVGS